MNADRLLSLYERVAEASDGIARLRRFVLDLGVRGKLVEQEPGDEPVERSFKGLEAEQSAALSLPNGWACVGLGKVLDFKYGKGLKASERLDEGPIPVFGSNGVVGYTTTPLAENPAIIIGRKGSAGALNLCEGPSWTTDVAYYVEAPPVFDLRYLFLTLQSAGLDMLGKGVKPGLSRADAYRLPLAIPPLAEQRRVVAKVEELMVILDRLEAAREEREAARDRLTAASLAAVEMDPAEGPSSARVAIAALPALTARSDQIKSLRQTILNLAVQGKLVSQVPSDEPALSYLLALDEVSPRSQKQLKPLAPSDCGGNLPNSWTWLPLGAVIREMDAGWSPQCENHPRSNEDQWGVLKTTSVQALKFQPLQNKLLPAKLEPRPDFQVSVGDILVTRAGPKNRVGISCVVDVPCPRLMLSDKLIRFHPLGELSSAYIALTLNAGYTLDRVEAAKSGMAVMQMNISQNKLRDVPIPIPPVAEQHRIVARVDALMALCDRLEAALTTVDSARARLLEALLHEALTPPPMAQAA
jgi:type I restriction enzyme S subunit